MAGNPNVIVRATAETKERWTEAANDAGYTLSEWVRAVCDAACEIPGAVPPPHSSKDSEREDPSAKPGKPDVPLVKDRALYYRGGSPGSKKSYSPDFKTPKQKKS